MRAKFIGKSLGSPVDSALTMSFRTIQDLPTSKPRVLCPRILLMKYWQHCAQVYCGYKGSFVMKAHSGGYVFVFALP